MTAEELARAAQALEGMRNAITKLKSIPRATGNGVLYIMVPSSLDGNHSMEKLEAYNAETTGIVKAYFTRYYQQRVNHHARILRSLGVTIPPELNGHVTDYPIGS